MNAPPPPICTPPAVRLRRGVFLVLLCALAVAGSGPSWGRVSKPRCPNPVLAHTDHANAGRHEISCGTQILGSLEVSETGGLGRIDVNGDLVAVLERDAGAVSLVDVSDPAKPEVLGRYFDNADQSLDGDVAFSDDGQWVFYARQTVRFSLDGLHVLNVADPTNPQLTFYQAQGGAARVEYYTDGTDEYVISLDATHGLVINRFVRPAGILVPVHIDALPATKVGGPASAGLFVQPHNKAFGAPLLYVTTGTTGLQVFDISNPATPVEVRAVVGDYGFAEVEVSGEGRTERVFLATEYWFDTLTPPEIIIVAADRKGTHPIRLKAEPDNLWRPQGMAIDKGYLFVAYSHAGLVIFDKRGRIAGVEQRFGSANEGSRIIGNAPYAFDVEVVDGVIYVSDASTGMLTLVRFG